MTAPPSGDDVLVVPPIPLASGSMLEPEDDGPPVRITKLEFVISTEDGAARILAWLEEAAPAAG